MEALQCLTIALAGSDAVGLREVVTTFFGTQQDAEHVWEYIDPKSKVARPLELEDTETEDDEEEESQPSSSSKASTSKRTIARAKSSSKSSTMQKPLAPKFKKVLHQDLVADIGETIQMIPDNPTQLSLTDIPAHLKGERMRKTSASSGASMYLCPHPKCDPIFVVKGGPAPL